MKQTVLMIDDDEAFLEELSEVLSSSGYQAVSVRNPLQAVETAKKVGPALILMDLKMPEKSGFRLASELKGQPGLSGIPIIAMSGMFESKVASLPGLSGFRKCLPKPFNPLDVIWMIEKVLSEGERRFSDRDSGKKTGQKDDLGKREVPESFDEFQTRRANDPY